MSPKESQRRYNQSEKGKARKKRYRQTLKGQIKRMQESYNYYWTHREQVLERNAKWLAENPNYQRERYYRLQNEMGYHGAPNEMLPGYRVIQGLMEAEVVEIDLSGKNKRKGGCK